jgi:hypothetical protein
MKTPDGIFTILASIVTLAIITTLVLPGRGTAADINAGGNAFTTAIQAAMGGK